MALFVLCFGTTYAQDTIQAQLDVINGEINSLKKEDKTHFMVRGFAQFGMDATSDNLSFNMTSFNPILLWRQGDRFLFESELEMEYMSNQFSLDLGYANASYVISKGLVVKVGKILIPLGTFGEKFHPSWVNKFSTAPLAVGHDGIAPMADIGIEIRGGLQLAKSKLSYSVYLVNGPRLNDGTDIPEEAGILSFENANDNNKNKAIGSRIGFLPFANSALEIGISGYYAKPGSTKSPFPIDSVYGDLNYKNVTALLTSFDLSYVKMIKPIKSIIDFKGQYNLSNVSKATYWNSENATRYTFDNNSSSYYAQLAFRPSMLDNNVLNKMEVVGRYSVYDTPRGALWASNQSQIAMGLNYWFTWRTVLKMSYQITDGVMSGTGMSGMGMHGSYSTSMMPMRVSMFLLYFATGL